MSLLEQLGQHLGRGDAVRIARLAERDEVAARRALVAARIAQHQEDTGAAPTWWLGGRLAPGRRPSERGL